MICEAMFPSYVFLKSLRLGISSCKYFLFDVIVECFLDWGQAWRAGQAGVQLFASPLFALFVVYLLYNLQQLYAFSNQQSVPLAELDRLRGRIWQPPSLYWLCSVCLPHPAVGKLAMSLDHHCAESIERSTHNRKF